jgi:hypothetical protein
MSDAGVLIARGRRVSHPVLVPPKIESTGREDDIVPASALRLLGWPERAISQAAKDRDATYRQCIAEYGAARCPCGALAITWTEEDPAL